MEESDQGNRNHRPVGDPRTSPAGPPPTRASVQANVSDIMCFHESPHAFLYSAFSGR